jgi:hypothetical protein
VLMITLFITYHLLFRYQFSNLTPIIQNGISTHITRYTVHGRLYMVHVTRYTLHVTRYTVHGTRYTVHGTQYTVHGIQYTVHGTRYMVHGIRYTIHGTHHTYSTLHCTLCYDLQELFKCTVHCTVQCTVHWDSIFRYSPVFLHLRDKTVVEYFNKYTFSCINMLLP